jgi:putative addiction module component (TIGR02574 family)
MNLSKLVRLSITERILLVEALWDSIHADRRRTPLSDEEIEMMEEKINSSKKSPYDIKNLNKIKSQLLKKN